jgi:histone-lysine N-methyltransferase SUV39H
VPLEIFRTVDGRGWGVRAKIDLNTGQYIDKYVGEIITGAEAQSRRDTSAFSQQKDVYLFALDKFTDELSMDPRLAGSPYEVDGEFISGPTRFINHSCNPNMRTFARVGDHADKHIHDLALFAIRNIPAGEELTFDYIDAADDLEEKTEDFNDPEMQRQMMVCLCGARNCRGYLW